jgi:hypothetical protein
MPRIVAHTPAAARAIVTDSHQQVGDLQSALGAIAETAADSCSSGADVAAVVYEQLARLGVVIP